jgi:hypothetical protein
MFSKLAKTQLGAVKKEFSKWHQNVLLSFSENTRVALKDALIVFVLFIVLEWAKRFLL